MNKFTVGVIVAIFACFGGLIVWSTMHSQDEKVDWGQYDSKAAIEPNDDNGQIGDHRRGNEKAKVLVVEYADFQCPSCAAIAPKIATLYEEYEDRVQFVFRHYPLSYHENARAAAAAAEAAGFQGKFWEMLETLYSNRADWMEEKAGTRTEAFVKLFNEIAEDGDETKFREDMGNENVMKKINFEQKVGKAEKVDATPAFYVNGEKVSFDDVSEQKDIKTVVEQKIKEALGE